MSTSNDLNAPQYFFVLVVFSFIFGRFVCFPILRDSTPVRRLRVCVVLCSTFQSGG